MRKEHGPPCPLWAATLPKSPGVHEPGSCLTRLYHSEFFMEASLHRCDQSIGHGWMFHPSAPFPSRGVGVEMKVSTLQRQGWIPRQPAPLFRLLRGFLHHLINLKKNNFIYCHYWGNSNGLARNGDTDQTYISYYKYNMASLEADSPNPRASRHKPSH